jgi:predicted glycosyltransferase
MAFIVFYIRARFGLGHKRIGGTILKKLQVENLWKH